MQMASLKPFFLFSVFLAILFAQVKADDTASIVDDDVVDIAKKSSDISAELALLNSRIHDLG